MPGGGGGLEECWKKIGPKVWPSYAPVWRLYADLLNKTIFFAKMTFFLTTFPFRRSNWLQITKNSFLPFLAFYPLISAFQALSRMPKGRSFRDLSIGIKNSSFHAVWLDIQIFDRSSIDFRPVKPRSCTTQMPEPPWARRVHRVHRVHRWNNPDRS